MSEPRGGRPLGDAFRAQRRRAPRPVGAAIGALAQAVAPLTALAQVQRVWADVVGSVVAAQAQPTAERDGVVTVSCRSSTWAQELDLMSVELVARLNEALGAPQVKGLRCQATAPRSWARQGKS